MSYRGTLRLYDGYPGTSPELAPLVHRVQVALTGWGYPVSVDGRYGKTTEGAVRRFQREHALASDGVVGPLTWAALMQDAAPVTFTVQLEGAGSVVLHRSSRPVDHEELCAQFNRFQRWLPEFDLPKWAPPSLVFAIGSRESGWGGYLKPRGPAGTGDGGHGRGLMQIDDRSHKPFTSGDDWKDPKRNVTYGLGILSQNIRATAGKTFLATDAVSRLRIAAAGYNCGLTRVAEAIAAGRDVDYFTAGRDYSADILDRMAWYLEKEQRDREAGV